jgi:cytochrome c-type biogenesis protein CcmH
MMNRPLRNTYYAILLLLIAFSFAIPVVAQGTTPTDDEVNRIAKQLYCPVCENTPLDVCPTEACKQWRELIRSMLAEGKSEQEIKDHFVKQYGARVLNEPPNRLAAYLVPAVAILAGTLLLLRGFQMWIKPLAAESTVPESEAQPVLDQPQDAYIARVEEELKKRK